MHNKMNRPIGVAVTKKGRIMKPVTLSVVKTPPVLQVVNSITHKYPHLTFVSTNYNNGMKTIYRGIDIEVIGNSIDKDSLLNSDQGPIKIGYELLSTNIDYNSSLIIGNILSRINSEMVKQKHPKRTNVNTKGFHYERNNNLPHDIEELFDMVVKSIDIIIDASNIVSLIKGNPNMPTFSPNSHPLQLSDLINVQYGKLLKPIEEYYSEKKNRHGNFLNDHMKVLAAPTGAGKTHLMIEQAMFMIVGLTGIKTVFISSPTKEIQQEILSRQNNPAFSGVDFYTDPNHPPKNSNKISLYVVTHQLMVNRTNYIKKNFKDYIILVDEPHFGIGISDTDNQELDRGYGRSGSFQAVWYNTFKHLGFENCFAITATPTWTMMESSRAALGLAPSMAEKFIILNTVPDTEYFSIDANDLFFFQKKFYNMDITVNNEIISLKALNIDFYDSNFGLPHDSIIISRPAWMDFIEKSVVDFLDRSLAILNLRNRIDPLNILLNEKPVLLLKYPDYADIRQDLSTDNADTRYQTIKNFIADICMRDKYKILFPSIINGNFDSNIFQTNTSSEKGSDDQEEELSHEVYENLKNPGHPARFIFVKNLGAMGVNLPNIISLVNCRRFKLNTTVPTNTLQFYGRTVRPYTGFNNSTSKKFMSLLEAMVEIKNRFPNSSEDDIKNYMILLNSNRLNTVIHAVHGEHSILIESYKQFIGQEKYGHIHNKIYTYEHGFTTDTNYNSQFYNWLMNQPIASIIPQEIIISEDNTIPDMMPEPPKEEFILEHLPLADDINYERLVKLYLDQKQIQYTWINEIEDKNEAYDFIIYNNNQTIYLEVCGSVHTNSNSVSIDNTKLEFMNKNRLNYRIYNVLVDFESNSYKICDINLYWANLSFKLIKLVSFGVELNNGLNIIFNKKNIFGFFMNKKIQIFEGDLPEEVTNITHNDPILFSEIGDLFHEVII